MKFAYVRTFSLLLMHWSVLTFFGLSESICRAQSEGTPTTTLVSGPYQLNPSGSHASCADVAGVSKTNGAGIQLWTCGGSLATNEYWTLVPISGAYGAGYQAVSVNSNLCLGVDNSSQANGAHLQQWQCTGANSPNQIWQFMPFNGVYELVSLNSGLCLDLPGGSSANGNLLQQWSCGQGNNPNQLWSITPLVAPTAPSAPTVPSPITSSVQTIPATYFGLTTLNFGAVHPAMAFGTTRSWDEYPTLDWADVNPSPGVYNFTYVDKFMSQNQGVGAEMIYTFGRTPLWASASPTAPSPYGPGECAPPSNLTQWDAYVTALTNHVAGRIHYWELWNEPDDPQFYCGNMPTMIAMAADAYRIIKQADPTAQIITPAATSTNGPGWLNAYLSAGGGNYADILSFHGYWGQTAESIQNVVASYQAVATKYGQSKKPLWDTEASWSGDPTHVLQGGPQQAAFLAKYYLLQWSDGIARFVWYAYDGGSTGGLWDAQTGVHPAGIAYGVVEKWMVGSQMTVPCVEDGNGTWTCTLTRNGDHALVIWNSTSNTNVTVKNEYLQQTDLTGATTTIAASAVLVGNSPVLLRTGGGF